MSILSYNARYSTTTDVYDSMMDTTALSDGARGDTSSNVTATSLDGQELTLYIVLSLQRTPVHPIRIEAAWESHYVNGTSAIDVTFVQVFSSTNGSSWVAVDSNVSSAPPDAGPDMGPDMGRSDLYFYPSDPLVYADSINFKMDAIISGAYFLKFKFIVPIHVASSGHVQSVISVSDIRLDEYPVLRWAKDVSYDLPSGTLTYLLDDNDALDQTTGENWFVGLTTGSGQTDEGQTEGRAGFTAYADCGPFSSHWAYKAESVVDAFKYGPGVIGGVNVTMNIDFSSGPTGSAWVSNDWTNKASLFLTTAVNHYDFSTHFSSDSARYWRLTVYTRSLQVGSSNAGYVLSGATDFRFTFSLLTPQTPTLFGVFTRDNLTNQFANSLWGT